MRISQEADYALRIIEYLGQREPELRCDVRTIANDICLPHRFAVKILRKLTLAGITKSYRGAYGGYTLNRRPVDVSFLDVVEAIDGPVNIHKCLADPDICNNNRKGNCFVRSKLIEVNDTIVAKMASLNFQKNKP